MKITILDPALCCSTGVCGPELDDSLLQNAADEKWLTSLGLEVARDNMSNDCVAFQEYPEALVKLKMDGLNSLPGNLLPALLEFYDSRQTSTTK